jgi:hypothetical protein
MANPKVDRAIELLISGAEKTVTEAAKAAGAPRTSVQSRWQEVKAGRPIEQSEPGFTKHDDGTASLVAEPGAKTSPEALLKKFGLDIEDWKIVRVRVNEWGDPPQPQLRVDAIPTELLIAPVDPDGWKGLPKPKKAKQANQSVVICGDHHCPHQDETLHRLFCSFLADEKPDLLVLLGDIADYSTVSRHRETEGFRQSVVECNRAVFDVLRDYREASPDTRVVMLPGNHDARVEYYILDKAPGLREIGPAFEEQVSAYSLRRLWRLDELGVDLVSDHDSDWERAKFPITEALTARHGYMTSKNAGETMLVKHSRSQIQGHSHRMQFTYKTKHDPIDVRLAVQAGTMAKIEDGLGYSSEPDWQQGFVYGHTWGTKDFALAPAIYVKGRLLLPDGRRYE